MAKLQELTANIGGKVRRRKLEGRTHLVVPAVMINEGVHEGNNGPLYYGPDDLSAGTSLWDHKPVVLFHPKDGSGKAVSACKPEAIDKHKLGILADTTFDARGGNRLRSECWLDEARTKELAPEVFTALERGDVLEVSTGLFTDVEETPGEWRGEKYDGVARNFRPDHLAILPGGKGACSVADGAGLNVNEVREARKVVGQLVVNEGGLFTNELSLDRKVSALWTAVREKFGDDAWPEESFDSFVVYRNRDGGLMKVAYHWKDEKAVLEDDPVRVERDVTYRPITNATQPTGSGNEGDMDKKKLVDGLIANAKSGYKEEHRQALMGLPDAILQTTVRNAEEATKEPASAPNLGAQVPPAPQGSAVLPQGQPGGGVPGGGTGAPQTGQGAVADEAIRRMQEEQTRNSVMVPKAEWLRVQALLANADRLDAANRQRCISQITANSQAFTEDELKSNLADGSPRFDTPTLERLASMAVQNAAVAFGAAPAGTAGGTLAVNYAGRGFGGDSGTLVDNSIGDDEGLDLPSTRPTTNEKDEDGI